MSFSEKIKKAVDHPDKLVRYAKIVARSIPYRLRLNKLLPRSLHLAHAPDRYVSRLDTYKERAAYQMFVSGNTSGWTAHNAPNSADMTRYYFLNLACDQLIKDDIKGDIAELGVYKGNSAYLLARLARHFGTTAFLFDTYESFDSRDLVGVDDNASLDSFSDTSLERVRAVVGEDNVQYVKGYFPDSLSQVEGEHTFCLAHIDCDLYAPMKAALEYFYPRMADGGMLIMHDYASMVWEGAEKAVDEFFADKPERPILIPDKSGTAVIRKMVGAAKS